MSLILPLSPLVKFFRSPAGAVMGRDGDDNDLSPEQCAVKHLRALMAERDALLATLEEVDAARTSTRKEWAAVCVRVRATLIKARGGK